ncbi:hypothetical protein [Planctomyces sp. SH-PL62]|uniref:hypothetical protein n=1 Tax=Planctomyces sp. SH-PL62 TaxID=1636152 RepID=UPI00078E82C3|nr:hypothetical protein [Planctomyces sp. SH-PL62]AMV40186.1 hypothetical protein VT85_22330 [Planctomyces sp. SH-PL62]
MFQLRATSFVSDYYPGAIKACELIEALLDYTEKELELREDQIAFLTSVCSDDLNSVQLPDNDMIGPFVLGGLDGYPFVGRTGIGAFSHHLPEEGAALMVVGPHVGITDDGQVGKVLRPGQSKPSDCCGAAAAALQKLVAGGIHPKQPADFDPHDYQQESLEQLMLKHSNEILHLGKSTYAWRFVRAAEVIYRETVETLFNFLKTVKFEAPAFVFGGILINLDGDQGAYFALRHAIFIDHCRFEDMTDEFRNWVKPKLDEFEAGNTDVFRKRNR